MSAAAPHAGPAITGRFVGKVVVITGGPDGIGSATARRLAAEDATPVLTGRNRNAAEPLLADLEQASFVAGDVRERDRRPRRRQRVGPPRPSRRPRQQRRD